MSIPIRSRYVLSRCRLVLLLAASALISATAVAATQVPADAGQDAHARSARRADGNGLIAFVRDGKIWTVDQAGANLTKLTPTRGNQRPHWSPDGSRIAFIHRSIDSWDVWVMDADGSNKQQVTHEGDVTEAQWSPNGNWLAFGPTLSRVHSTAPFGDPVEILGKTDPDSPLQTLQVDTSLAWSPDGDHIAYYSHQFPDSPDNFLLVLDLTTDEVIEWNGVGGSCCGEGFFGNPAWSIDGSQLAYDLLRYSPEDGEFRTRPLIQLDNFPSGTNGGYTNARGNKDPEFSPDGTQLLISHIVKGRLSIQVTNLDGSNRHRIVRRAYQPDWQPLP
jgi:Tol biopolymer transport system component